MDLITINHQMPSQAANNGEIEASVDAFASYLILGWRTSGSSRYATMGPVQDIVDAIHAGNYTRDSLLGIAVAKHERARKHELWPDALHCLRVGIERTLALIEGLPTLTRRHVLQAIVNSVYFRSREHSITMRERWAAFLATRYADDAALQTAWVDPDAQLPAPKYNRDYLDEHAQTKTDFAEFIQHTNHEILTHFQNAAG